jgi:hypothetical protein
MYEDDAIALPQPNVLNRLDDVSVLPTQMATVQSLHVANGICLGVDTDLESHDIAASRCTYSPVSCC